MGGTSCNKIGVKLVKEGLITEDECLSDGFHMCTLGTKKSCWREIQQKKHCSDLVEEIDLFLSDFFSMEMGKILKPCIQDDRLHCVNEIDPIKRQELEKACKIWPNYEFDYSLVNYIKAILKIIIICNTCKL